MKLLTYEKEELTTNPYLILEVDKKATTAQIKSAYLKLSQQHHPDKHPHDVKGATIRWRRINEAYELLKNKNRRKIYDQLGYNEKQLKEALEKLIPVIVEAVSKKHRKDKAIKEFVKGFLAKEREEVLKQKTGIEGGLEAIKITIDEIDTTDSMVMQMIHDELKFRLAQSNDALKLIEKILKEIDEAVKLTGLMSFKQKDLGSWFHNNGTATTSSTGIYNMRAV